MRKVFVALVTAGIAVALTFASTRASEEDIELVRVELREVEREGRSRRERIEGDLAGIRETIQAEAVEAASFRAEVRAALEIRDGH